MTALASSTFWVAFRFWRLSFGVLNKSPLGGTPSPQGSFPYFTYHSAAHFEQQFNQSLTPNERKAMFTMDILYTLLKEYAPHQRLKGTLTLQTAKGMPLRVVFTDINTGTEVAQWEHSGHVRDGVVTYWHLPRVHPVPTGKPASTPVEEESL